MLPTAKPFAEGKQDTTRVCHLSGETKVWMMTHPVSIFLSLSTGDTDLEGSSGVLEVEDLDVALGSANDHQREYDVQCVTPFRELNSRHWVRCPQVPVLYTSANHEGAEQYDTRDKRTLTVLSQLPVASTLP